MNIDNSLELLKQIKQVETPPYLFTRIKQKIQSLSDAAPSAWKWAFAVMSAVILSLNVGALLSKGKLKTNNTSLEQVVDRMNLISSNHLYND
jgi:hypothetical protein